jgi:hypothetical protein
METEAEIRALNGKDGRGEDRMLVRGTLYTRNEFENTLASQFTKREIKRGFIATHYETWVWDVAYNRFGQLTAYRSNAQLHEIK